MIDTDKYEGHTEGPWEAKDVGFSAGESPWNDLDLSLEENQNLSGLPTEWVVVLPLIIEDFMGEADAQLIADAPLLLAEVKRLRKQLAYDSKVYHEMCEEGIMAWNNAECRLAGEEEMFGEVD